MAVTTHKVINITLLGSPEAAATLTLRFKTHEGEDYPCVAQGHISSSTTRSGYSRSLPVGSDNWQLVSVDCSGPATFSVRDA